MAKTDPILRAFGCRLKQNRELKGLTQESLAEKAGLDRTYLSDIERGTRNPGIRNVITIIGALGIPPSDFFGGWSQ